jgi:hypothetical protein
VLGFLDQQGARPLPFDDASGMSPPPAFGTYRVLHQIGSGVLGPVFRAYDSQQDRLVAIKAVKLDLVPETGRGCRGTVARYRGAPVPHPAIAGVVDAGLEGSTPFVALEFLSGDALDVMLRQSGPLALKRALPILRVLAEALDAATQPAWITAHCIRATSSSTWATPTSASADSASRVRWMPAVCACRSVVPYSAPERVTSHEWGRPRRCVFARRDGV